jgi:hypothetical protein
MTTDKIKITMSERRPLTIDPELWPVIAQADWYNGQHEFQANTIRRIKVRQHADGRRIVYGFQRAGNGGQPIGTRNPEAGFLLAAGADEDETIRAIRRVGRAIDAERLAEHCIADLPAEEIDEDAEEIDGSPVGDGVVVPVEKLPVLLALLVQARPHCPPDLQAEISAAVKDTQ